MPCKPAKARYLLNAGKAKVVRKNPFTIQLLTATGESKQEVVAGMDSGSKKLGCTAITNGKVVYSSEVELRNDISTKMTRRRTYRRTRRGRKTRYRKPRFNNRANSKRKERLAPSIKMHKLVREKQTVISEKDVVEFQSYEDLLVELVREELRYTFFFSIWDFFDDDVGKRLDTIIYDFISSRSLRINDAEIYNDNGESVKISEEDITENIIRKATEKLIPEMENEKWENPVEEIEKEISDLEEKIKIRKERLEAYKNGTIVDKIMEYLKSPLPYQMEEIDDV